MGISHQLAERTAARLGATHVFRPRSTYLVAALWLTVALVWLVISVRDGALLRQLPLIALLAALAYATSIRPLVATLSGGVLVRNVLRDVTVPWSELTEIRTQYALTLLTRSGATVTAWAAPAAGRFSTARAAQSDLKSAQRDHPDGPPPAGAGPRSDAGAAAAAVRTEWDRARRDGATPAVSVQVRWALPLLIVLVITVLATAATLIWP